MVWFLKKPSKKKEQKAEQVEKKEEQFEEKLDKFLSNIISEKKEHRPPNNIDEVFKRCNDHIDEVIDALGNLKIKSEKNEFKKLPEYNQKSKNMKHNKLSKKLIFCSRCGKIIAEKSDLEKTPEGKSEENNLNKVKIIIKFEPKTEKPDYKHRFMFARVYHICDDCLKEFSSKLESDFECLNDVFKFFKS
jgi:hypothetical protein